MRAAEVETKGERCEQAAVKHHFSTKAEIKRHEIEGAIRKPVNRSARVHVAAHLLRQQKMIDGLFSISHATASDARHVSTPETRRYVIAISQSDLLFWIQSDCKQQRAGTW